MRLSADRGAKRRASRHDRDDEQRSAVRERAARTNELLEALHSSIFQHEHPLDGCLRTALPGAKLEYAHGVERNDQV